MAVAAMWAVSSYPETLDAVLSERMLGPTVALVSADRSLPTVTRVLATNFLCVLTGGPTGSGAHPNAADASVARDAAARARFLRSFADEMEDNSLGLGSDYPQLELLVNLLDDDDPIAQQYAAGMIVRTAVDQRRKATISALGGTRLLCELLASSGEARVVAACMHALLNLSTHADNQVVIGRHGLNTLLAFSRNTDFAALGDVAAKVLSNVQKHGANRTKLYAAELRLRAADILQRPGVRFLVAVAVAVAVAVCLVRWRCV